MTSPLDEPFDGVDGVFHLAAQPARGPRQRPDMAFARLRKARTRPY